MLHNWRKRAVVCVVLSVEWSTSLHTNLIIAVLIIFGHRCHKPGIVIINDRVFYIRFLCYRFLCYRSQMIEFQSLHLLSLGISSVGIFLIGSGFIGDKTLLFSIFLPSSRPRGIEFLSVNQRWYHASFPLHVRCHVDVRLTRHRFDIAWYVFNAGLVFLLNTFLASLHCCSSKRSVLLAKV